MTEESMIEIKDSEVKNRKKGEVLQYLMEDDDN